MTRKRLLVAGLIAASALGLAAPSQASTSVTLSCTYHPEYPLRKYDCSGTGVGYGTWWCSAHWADSNSDGDWESGNARIYSMSCTSATGSYSCNEGSWFDYTCSATGVRGNAFCTTYNWTDNDADPNPGTVTSKSCVGLQTVLDLINA